MLVQSSVGSMLKCGSFMSYRGEDKRMKCRSAPVVGAWLLMRLGHMLAFLAATILFSKRMLRRARVPARPLSPMKPMSRRVGRNSPFLLVSLSIGKTLVSYADVSMTSGICNDY